MNLLTAPKMPESERERLSRFLADQVDAVGILRDEKIEGQVSRRVQAMGLAIDYLQAFPMDHPTLGRVLATAKRIKSFLLEP